MRIQKFIDNIHSIVNVEENLGEFKYHDQMKHQSINCLISKQNMIYLEEIS